MVSEQADQFRQAIMNSAIGLAVANREQRLMLVNPAFCKITGYSERELLSMRWPALTHPADRAKNFELARAMYAGKLRSFLLEKRYIKKSGAIVWVRNSTCVFEEENGIPITFMALVEDITELRRSTAEVRRLSSQLLKAQDDERRRFARDLHDTTAQNLSALGMILAGLKRRCSKVDSSLVDELESASLLAKQIAREIRTVSYLLHPPMLDEFGLAHALRWYIRGFSQRSGIRLNLKVPDDLPRLPINIETTLFRIVQESLNNVWRHSGSTRARVRIQTSTEDVQLLVRDFGKGMPIPASTNGDSKPLGVGILGMQERLREFGGKLHIASDRTGTVLQAIIPLARSEAK